jgi:hypothetical protein
VVTLSFSAKPGTSLCKWLSEGPASLLKMTSTVQIVIEPFGKKGGQISARFSVVECVALLGGQWPNSETFDRIACAVRERKHYPMPVPEIPGGGGKSMTAQGQTKKAGSHSHDRHR